MWLDARFQDLIYGAGLRVGVTDLSPDSVENALVVIGVVDLAVALGLLLPLRRLSLGCALWMAFWGFLTAASRTLHSGFEWCGETLLRAPNGGVPLAVALLLWRARSPGPVATTARPNGD